MAPVYGRVLPDPTISRLRLRTTTPPSVASSTRPEDRSRAVADAAVRAVRPYHGHCTAAPGCGCAAGFALLGPWESCSERLDGGMRTVSARTRMTGRCNGSSRTDRTFVRPGWLRSDAWPARWPFATHETSDRPASLASEEPLDMIKRILLGLALAASLGGAVLACNTPATSVPSVAVPSTAPISSPAPSDALMSAEPSAS